MKLRLLCKNLTVRNGYTYYDFGEMSGNRLASNVFRVAGKNPNFKTDIKAITTVSRKK